MISDRPSLVQWLGDIGLEVTRQTPKAISIKHPDDAKARPIRLTGAIYEQDFRHTGESTELTAAASASYRAAATERYTASCERYDKMLAAKGEYHQQRYRPQSQRDPQSPERSYDSTIAADRAEHGKDQGATAAGHDSTIATATAADRAAISELAAIERLEPRHRTSSKYQETLTRSNTALILLACTMLISSICLGYVSKSKYNEIQVKRNVCSRSNIRLSRK